MGSDSQHQIPVIDFTINSQEVVRGSDEWYHLCKKVREACEKYGCFEVVYDKVPPQLRDEFFSASRKLFSLPLETKKKNMNPIPIRGYIGPSVHTIILPCMKALAFMKLRTMNPLEASQKKYGLVTRFGINIVSMMKQLDELKNMIHLIILDSYGLEESSNSIMMSKRLLRLMKYSAPPSGEYMMASPAHTDKNFGTIICDDQVSGLEVQTKDEQWVKLSISPRSFVFVVGDSLMAWSNGRMHSVIHRVMMCGEKERYSLAAFAEPIEGSIIKAQKELVDEDYPQILRNFDYTQFCKFIFKEGRAIDTQKQVFAFAGIGA